MLLREIAYPSVDLIRSSVSILCDFVDGSVDGSADLTRAVRVLMSAFPQTRFKGSMRRVMKAPRHLEFRDIRSMTTTIHQYILRTNNARKFFSWTTLPAEQIIKNVSVGAKGSLWFCMEQDYYGLDVIQCLKWASQDSSIDDQLQQKIHVSIENAEPEQEIIASFSNNVHVVGFFVNYKFYDVNDLRGAINAYRNLDNQRSSFDV